MATNLALDDGLVEEAKKLGKHDTKRAAVNEALAEYVARRKRRRILDLFRKLDWDSKYDYKAERRRRG
jgi:Arc/MetJ family transcription regulator